MARKSKLTTLDIIRAVLSLGTSLVYKESKGRTGDSFRVVGSIFGTIFLTVFLWPHCLNSLCTGILWGDISTPNATSYAFYLLIFLFIFPLYMGMHGVYSYLKGYGHTEYYEPFKYSLDSTEKRRKLLLYDSVGILILSLWIVSLCIWNILLMREAGIYLWI